MSDLSPSTRYWHGTKARLRRGDRLLPRREHGGAPTTAPVMPCGDRLPESDDWVYLTTDFALAWAYAHAAGGDGPPVVLMVKPQDALEHDPEHSDWMPVYRCGWALIELVDDEPRITAEQAALGWKPAEDRPLRP